MGGWTSSWDVTEMTALARPILTAGAMLPQREGCGPVLEVFAF